MDPATRAIPRLWPHLLACAAAALWVDFGTIHRDHHGDSLMPVLASLQRWTPFLWEQDRFGMAVPLLALPFRSPMANLLVQVFLTTTCGLAAFFLLPRHLLRDASYPAAGAIGAASFLALTPHYYRFEYLVDTSYGVAFCLALGALILLEDGPRGGSIGRLAPALALMAAAHWVNSATAYFLAPVLVLRRALDFRRLPAWPELARPGSLDEAIAGGVALARRAWRSELVRALVALGAGHAAGGLLAGLAPDGAQTTSYESVPVVDWPAAWRQLAGQTRDALAPPYWPWALAAEAGLGAAWWLRRGARRDSGPAGQSALALLVVAALLGLLMGTRVWVRINQYAFRYLFPSAVLAGAAAAALAAAPVRRALMAVPTRWRGGSAPLASSLALLAAALISYGWPSPAGVRGDLDRRCGALTADLIAAGCTHLAGDYWAVWPAVFHANLVLRERGQARTVWGVTFRSSPTYALWKEMPRERVRVGIPRGDGMAETFMGGYQLLPAIEVEARPTIRVVRPAPRPARRGGGGLAKP